MVRENGVWSCKGGGSSPDAALLGRARMFGPYRRLGSGEGAADKKGRSRLKKMTVNCDDGVGGNQVEESEKDQPPRANS